MGEYFTMLTKCGLVFPVQEFKEGIIVLRPLQQGDWAFCENGRVGQISTITIENGKKMYKGKTDDGSKWKSSNPIPSPKPTIDYLTKRLQVGKFKARYIIEGDVEGNVEVYKFIFDIKLSNIKDILLKKGIYYNTFIDLRCVFLNILCIYELGTIWCGKEKKFIVIR